MADIETRQVTVVFEVAAVGPDSWGGFASEVQAMVRGMGTAKRLIGPVAVDTERRL